MSEKTNHFDAAIKNKYGIEGASKILSEKGIAELAALLAAAGQTAKAEDEQPVKTDAEQVEGKYDHLLTLVGELIELQNQHVSTVNGLEDEIKSLRDSRTKAQSEHDAELGAVKKDIADLKAFIADTPRASQTGKSPTPEQTDALKKQEVDPAREFLFGKQG